MIKLDKDELLNKAIENQNYVAIKSFFISELRTDPSFRDGEVKRIVKILQKKTPEIFQEYELQSGEEQFKDDSSFWDWEYYIHITFMLGENFSFTRLEQIKKVGEFIAKERENNTHMNLRDVPPAEGKTDSRKKIVILIGLSLIIFLLIIIWLKA